MANSVVVFDKQFLDLIKFHQNVEVKSLLNQNQNLAKFYQNDLTTLLHFAAEYKNPDIASLLIAMGSHINSIDLSGETPLMIAVSHEDIATVEVLLNAGANVDVSLGCKTALDMVFDRNYPMLEIRRLFVKKVQNDAATDKQAITKLSKAGCNLYDAATLQESNLLKSMLKYGVPADDYDLHKMATLHTAINRGDLKTAKWLLEQGAAVNGQDNEGLTALMFAAVHMNKYMLKLLLEYGADPNIGSNETRETPLFIVVSNESEADITIVNECVKILLENGAIPRNLVGLNGTIFDKAFDNGNDTAAKFMIAQLAMMKKIGRMIDESIICSHFLRFETHINGMKNYYKECLNKCEMVLNTTMFKNVTLFHLLTRNYGLRLYARNPETFRSIEIISVQQNLSVLYPYYYELLMKRIDEINDLIKLEDKSIPVVCALLKLDPSAFYLIAKNIVSYLEADDLKCLLQM